MNTKFLFTVASAVAVFLCACSDSKHTNSWEEENGNEDYADSFLSSSSLSDRYDVNYGDTLVVNDTNELYFELAKIDTVKDSTGSISVKKHCSDGFICLDSLKSEVSLFLGELAKGSRVRIGAATLVKNSSIQVRTEKGKNLDALTQIYNGKDSIFADYMVPGSTKKNFNSFVAFNKGFHYLNIKADFDSTTQFSLFVAIDTLYYKYTGDTTDVSMGIQDTLHGIIPFETAPSKVNVNFTAPLGYSINVNALGQWIVDYTLFEGKEVLSTKKMPSNYYDEIHKGRDSLGLNTLMPIDSTSWIVKMTPMAIEYDLSGHYATFDVITNSRKLLQGEYLAKPDSVVQPGDTAVTKRPYSVDYVLRREQFIWLANVKAKDSLDIYHNMAGFFTTKGEQSVSIINAKGKVLKSGLSTLDYRYVATEDGPIYLHYISTCASKNEQNGCGELTADNKDQSLKFYTTISHYGSLTSIKFYDQANRTELTTKRVQAGETLTLSSFGFQTVPSGSSKNVKWYIPCADLNKEADEKVFSYNGYSCKTDSNEGDQELASTKLTISSTVKADSRARLIAESMADPTKRDTLTVIVRESDE